MDLFNELYCYAAEIPVISTHSHHNYHQAFEDFSLEALMRTTYPGFRGQRFDEESWAQYFERSACCSDSFWLHRALGDLYLDGAALNLSNYKLADLRLREAYAQDPWFHEKIITEICRIETLILDEHRDPGSDHALPFVRPALRVDWALAADSRAEALLGGMPSTLDGYLDAVDRFILGRIARYGVVALKLASAYERPLDFAAVSREDACTAYAGDRGRALGDYVMQHICRLAARENLPVQIHTGLGQLDRTRAMNLLPLIRRNPDVRFALLHCSFPWAEDALALAYTCPNVYLDLAWIFTLSDSMARRFLREALDFVPLDRFTWGCDTWTAEEGLGALMAVREGLAAEFAARIGEGRMDLPSAYRAIEMILCDNARNLYNL